MEPPAVTSCSPQNSISASNNGASIEKMRRGMAGGGSSMASSGYHLQIDPNISFNSSVNRPFEELPENFLETISPQQSQPPVQQDSPQLASLAPMSLGASDNAYATLAPMSATPGYGSSMKIEPITESIHHSGSLHHSGHPSPLDKISFSSGPAGLLSPLHTNRPDSSMNTNLMGVHQNGARASDMLSSLRRPVQYIKEEIDLSQEFKPLDTQLFSHHQSQQPTSLMTQEQQQQQELDHRLANAETPPAVSNVELASSFIATMIGEQPPDSPTPQQTLYEHNSHAYRHQLENTELSGSDDLDVGGAGPSDEPTIPIDDVPQSPSTANIESVAGWFSTASLETDAMCVARTSYSTKDTSDPLNAEIDDDIYIDTKDLCKRIAWELKQHSIPQAIFAERILCRSQGTLSDLLRNPKPWNKLKSGRETFRRMFNWVQQPLELRLGILDMYKGGADENFGGHNNGLGKLSGIPRVLSPPTPAQNARQGSRHKHDGENAGHGHNGSSTKRPRLVFTDIQKRTLQAIFKETQRPSREMQQTIAEHLRLDLSTVANFFMNARRRSRSGPLVGDAPAPYQQVRPITPPPESPPHQRSQGRSRTSRHSVRTEVESGISVATSSHIEHTVAQVAEEAAEYARRHEPVENGARSSEEQSPNLDCSQDEPEYKMMRLNDCGRIVDSRHPLRGCAEVQGTCSVSDDVRAVALSASTASTITRRAENIYVVSVPAAVPTDSNLSYSGGQQQRMLPVMSFGSKVVTVKVEREGSNVTATAPE
uniref:One cut domain family member n=1 Tax=Ascaris suum TaxID=6253 RepID=F1KW23_ASCSU